MTSRTSTFPLRLPVSMKKALEAISERGAEKIAAMETEQFFADAESARTAGLSGEF